MRIRQGQSSSSSGTAAHTTDAEVLRHCFRFAWSESDEIDSWGARMAKRYYDKLFREFALCDLSRYQEGKVGLRWRTEREVVDGKGQFTCGNVSCNNRDGLSSYELNFRYKERDEVRNELGKVRCCPKCYKKISKISASSGGGASSSSSSSADSSKKRRKDEEKEENRSTGVEKESKEEIAPASSSSAEKRPKIETDEDVDNHIRRLLS